MCGGERVTSQRGDTRKGASPPHHLLGGALQVSLEHKVIGQVDAQRRVGLLEDVLGEAGVVLVHGERVAAEDGERVLETSTCSAGLLAEGGDGVGEAEHDDCVQRADVNSELERRGSYDAEERAWRGESAGRERAASQLYSARPAERTYPSTYPAQSSYDPAPNTQIDRTPPSLQYHAGAPIGDPS